MKKRFKYILSLMVATFGVLPAVFAQATSGSSESGSDALFTLFITMVVIVVVAAVFAFMKVGQIQKMISSSGEEEGSVPEGESGFSAWYKGLTNATPVEKEMDILLDHDYDGIGELDNPLPPWWVALFWMTIIFAVGYWGYYETMDKGLSQSEEYAEEIRVKDLEVAAHLEATGGAVNESNVELSTDEADLAKGKEIYDANCVICHLADGGGSVGPNFTDNYWINGGSIGDIFKTIKYGVPEKGMVPWEDKIGPVDMAKVASYIKLMTGTTPAVAKDAQGALYEGE